MTRIDNTIWLRESFSWKNPHPAWKCPICNHGTLKGDNKTLKISQTQDTIKAKHSLNYESDEYAGFRFAGFLICGNNKCKEKIAVLGSGKLYSTHSDQVVGVQYLGERYSVFFPKYFEPPLNIFPIYDSCPKLIDRQIKLSFSHYFNDLSASANAIRKSLELIMDDRKVVKTREIKKGKRQKLTLDKRINYFSEKYPDLKPILVAAKWIGNAGSHVGDISKEDVLDGFNLLQHCIDEIYDKPQILRELNAKARSINKAKKPLRRKKT